MNDNDDFLNNLIIPNNINSLNQNMLKIKKNINNNMNKIKTDIINITDKIDFINNDITEINNKINSEDGNIITGNIDIQTGILNVNIEDTDEDNRIVNKKYVDYKISESGNVDFNGQNDFKESPCSITSQGSIKIGVDNSTENPKITLNSNGTIEGVNITVNKGKITDEPTQYDDIVNKKYVDENGGVDPYNTLNLKNNLSLTAKGSVYIGYNEDTSTETIELNKDGSINIKNGLLNDIILDTDNNKSIINKEYVDNKLNSYATKDELNDYATLNSINDILDGTTKFTALNVNDKLNINDNGDINGENIKGTSFKTNISNSFAKSDTGNKTKLQNISSILTDKISINNKEITEIQQSESSNNDDSKITTKGYVDEKFNSIDTSNCIKKSDVVGLNDEKTPIYTKIKTDNLLLEKFDRSDLETYGSSDSKKVYTKDSINNLLSTYVTQTELDDYKSEVSETYVTQTELDDYKSEVSETYATQTELNNYKSEVSNTYATRTELNNYISEVSETYATQTELNNYKSEVSETYATQTELNNYKSEVSNTYATQTELNTTNNSVNGIIDGTISLNSVKVNDNIVIDNTGNINGQSINGTNFKTNNSTSFATNDNNKTKLQNISSIYTDKITLNNKEIIDVEITDDLEDNNKITSKKYVDNLINSADNRLSNIENTLNNILDDTTLKCNSLNINNNIASINDEGKILGTSLEITNNVSSSTLTLNNNIINDISTSSSSVSINKDNNLTTQGYVDLNILNLSTDINNKFNNIVDNSNNIQGNSYKIINSEPFAVLDTTKTKLQNISNITADTITLNSGTIENNIEIQNNSIINYKNMIDYVNSYTDKFDPTERINLIGCDENNVTLTTTNNIIIGCNDLTPLGQTILNGTNGNITTKGNITGINLYINDTNNNNKASITNDGVIKGISFNIGNSQIISKNNENINVNCNNLTSDKVISKSLDIKDTSSNIKANIDNNGNITTIGKVSSSTIELNNESLSLLKYDSNNQKLILSSNNEVDIISGNNNISIKPNIDGIQINSNVSFVNDTTFNNIILNSKTVNNISTSSSSVSTNKDNTLTTQGYVDNQMSSFDGRLTNDETAINNINAQLSSIGQSYYIEYLAKPPFDPTQYIEDINILFYDNETETPYEYTLMEWSSLENKYIAKNVPDNTTCIVKNNATYIKTGQDTLGNQKWVKNTFNMNETLTLTNQESIDAKGNITSLSLKTDSIILHSKNNSDETDNLTLKQKYINSSYSSYLMYTKNQDIEIYAKSLDGSIDNAVSSIKLSNGVIDTNGDINIKSNKQLIINNNSKSSKIYTNTSDNNFNINSTETGMYIYNGTNWTNNKVSGMYIKQGDNTVNPSISLKGELKFIRNDDAFNSVINTVQNNSDKSLNINGSQTHIRLFNGSDYNNATSGLLLNDTENEIKGNTSINGITTFKNNINVDISKQFILNGYNDYKTYIFNENNGNNNYFNLNSTENEMYIYNGTSWDSDPNVSGFLIKKGNNTATPAINPTITIKGDITNNGTITNIGNTTFNGTSNFKNDVTIDNNKILTAGASNFNGNVSISPNNILSVGGESQLNSLVVDGTSDFNDDVNIDANLSVNSTSNFNNNVNINGSSNALYLKQATAIEFHGRNGTEDDNNKKLRIEGYNKVSDNYQPFDIRTNNTLNIYASDSNNTNIGKWDDTNTRGIRIEPYISSESLGSLIFKGESNFNDNIIINGQSKKGLIFNSLSNNKLIIRKHTNTSSTDKSSYVIFTDNSGNGSDLEFFAHTNENGNITNASTGIVLSETTTNNERIGNINLNTYKLVQNGETNTQTTLSNINMNGDIINLNGTIKINSISIEQYIIDKLYPVGSLYITTTQLSGTKSTSGSSYRIKWMGCNWEFLYSSDGIRYLSIGTKPSGSGTSWNVSGGGTTGGNKLHQHQIDSVSTNTHKLTEKEIPYHEHSGRTDGGTSHRHGINLKLYGNDGGGSSHSEDWNLAKTNKGSDWYQFNSESEGSHTHNLNTSYIMYNGAGWTRDTWTYDGHSHNLPTINVSKTGTISGSTFTQYAQDTPLYLMIYVYKRIS